jgi:hypothetical protein
MEDFMAQSESDFTIDFTPNDELTILAYTGSEKDLVIPDTIEGYPVLIIGEGAFRDKGLTSLVLPKDVQRIEKEAFASNKLTTLTLPDNLRFIGENAFASNGLTSLTLAKGTGAELSDGAFSSNKLTSIKLSSGIVRKHVFAGNPITRIAKPWTIPVDEEAFEKDFYEFYSKAGHETGTFEKKTAPGPGFGKTIIELHG